MRSRSNDRSYAQQRPVKCRRGAFSQEEILEFRAVKDAEILLFDLA